MSSKTIVLYPLYQEKAYSRASFLPNVIPSCPQLLPGPAVFKNQVGLIENTSGSKRNNYCPGQEKGVLKSDRT